MSRPDPQERRPHFRARERCHCSFEIPCRDGQDVGCLANAKGAGSENAARAQSFTQDIANERINALGAQRGEALEPAIQFGRHQKGRRPVYIHPTLHSSRCRKLRDLCRGREHSKQGTERGFQFLARGGPLRRRRYSKEYDSVTSPGWKGTSPLTNCSALFSKLERRLPHARACLTATPKPVSIPFPLANSAMARMNSRKALFTAAKAFSSPNSARMQRQQILAYSTCQAPRAMTGNFPLRVPDGLNSSCAERESFASA